MQPSQRAEGSCSSLVNCTQRDASVILESHSICAQTAALMVDQMMQVVAEGSTTVAGSLLDGLFLSRTWKHLVNQVQESISKSCWDGALARPHKTMQP